METIILLKEIAKILLLVGAFGLCVVVAWGLVKLFPHLRRMVEQLGNTAEAASKIGGDFAAVSADVAGDVRRTAASTAAGAEHLANTAGAASKISGDFAAVSADVAGDVQKTAALTAETAKNLMESSVHLQGALQILKVLKRVDLDKLAVNLATILKGGASQIPEVWRNLRRRVPSPNS